MRWELVQGKTSLLEDAGSQEIVATILENRGLKDLSQQELFLNPPSLDKKTLLELQGLFEKGQLAKSVSLVKEAIKQNRPIVIHGDYDVDGICSTAILWECIYYDLGYKNVTPFIPHRVDHGYGLSKESIDAIEAKNPLLITVDCGITAKESVEYAKEKGFEVIITDHHTLPGKKDLPKAAAILHTYELCGTGIAWVLANALSQSEKRLELVALATVADIQPLTNFNRTLVWHGLKVYQALARSGLKAIFEVAGVDPAGVGTYELGWLVAPRLNATGRLEHALEALRLVCTTNYARALSIAKELDSLNWQRQQLTQRALEEAREQVQTDDVVIVAASDKWHEGIIGLIAGKLAQEFYRPTIAIAISSSDKLAKASARSVAGVDLMEILGTCKDLFSSFGGHKAAAGFSMQAANVSKLSARLNQAVTSELKEIIAAGPVLKIDLQLQARHLTWQLFSALQKLSPHGLGNPKPLFVSRNLQVEKLTLVGAEKQHASFVVSQSGQSLRAIAFGLAEKARELDLKVQDGMDLVYNLEKDDYTGGESLQLKVKDFNKSNGNN